MAEGTRHAVQVREDGAESPRGFLGMVRSGAGLTEKEWTDEKIGAAVKMLPEGFRDPGSAIAFLAQASISGLNPFKPGELWAWKDDRNNLVFMTGRDGHLKMMREDPTITGVEIGVVRDGEAFEWSRLDGRVTITHKGSFAAGEVLGAYCCVHIEGDRSDVMEMRLMSDYSHLHGKKNWRTAGIDMIQARVASAAARLACPRAAGIYTQADFDLSENRPAFDRSALASASRDRTEKLAAALEDESAIEVTATDVEPESGEILSSREDEEGGGVPLGAGIAIMTEGCPRGFGIRARSVEPNPVEHPGEIVVTYYAVLLGEDGAVLDTIGEPVDDKADAYEVIARYRAGEAPPADVDEDEEAGGLETTTEPCPICAEPLRPKQKGGHAAGHTKRGETIPDAWRIVLDGNKYRLIDAEGEIVDAALTEVDTADGTISGWERLIERWSDRGRHLRPVDADEDELERALDEEEATEPEPEAAPEPEPVGSWEDEYLALNRYAKEMAFPRTVIQDVAQELFPEQVVDGRVLLQKMEPEAIREIAEEIQRRAGA